MAYKSFTVETDLNGIALVTWDDPGRLMNVLDVTALVELEEIVKRISSDKAVKGAVITSAKQEFSNGADLSMLYQLSQRYAQMNNERGHSAAAQALFDESRRSSLVFRAIECSGKPWVAAISGSALGAGFELTLSCHYRIASDSPKTRLGFPGIKVGLLPGAGGTQRVPRIIGLPDAMQILKGQELPLMQAKALKLVDAIVPPEVLIQSAKDWLLSGGKAMVPWDDENFDLPSGPVYSNTSRKTFRASNALHRRDTYDNYPAARALLSCVYEGMQLPMDAALRVESRYFTQILSSRSAQAMIRTLGLSSPELGGGARRPQGLSSVKIGKVAIIGAGFMGASVGYLSARAGIDVVLINRRQESADKAKLRAETAFNNLIAKGAANESERDLALSRITATTDYATLKDCDLVLESVLEDRMVKSDAYAKAQPFLNDHAIIASNTSTLPITSLAQDFKDRSRFIGMHFFSPAEKMMLVEIIRGQNTGDVALATALDYVRKIGKIPIVVNDSRGFFANRCVRRYTFEGTEMFLEGVPPAMIENCARMAGMPVGPLSLSDEVALDLRLKIMNATEADLGPNAVNQSHKKLMVELVEKLGRWGRKNGKGFYEYPEKRAERKRLWPGLSSLQPKRLDPDDVDVEELKLRFLVVQAVEAARTVAEHVVTDPREADVGSILGFGFAPFTGGVLSFIELMGIKKFVEVCERLEAKFGDRFSPPKLLQEMANSNETFYGEFSKASCAT
ncbi:3-hydroxyacyl-CoA dehydrogenase [Bradyrhizobium canariense]|uniref:3-hydroxyacyl-CoA dehydrogenase NAD-binding domain-containing protein n=1 Tax=Bradyrhizobium canariense TaxID=255045 RepID=UPI000A18D805|nr:3-hydroxyacyl-CoA dehydrogenase NAD-binding domain-containing protein [Bradyrhizobium canariense]OSI75603.1 3-hydroxyacyl-CoA dehydrogenase [Bradyrhizobium canariense]